MSAISAIDSHPILEETKANIEKDMGLTLEQMEQMDMCDIINRIADRKRQRVKHVPEVYKKTRGSTYVAMGKILTEEAHEKRIKKLLKKYL